MSRSVQLRNVSETLHRKLKARAALAGLPLSAYLVRELRKVAEYPTHAEVRARLKERSSYRGTASPTAVLRAERDSR